MTTSKEIAKRFREVTLNGTWIANTNWQAQISSISYETATSKIGSLNTIALLTFHINYYIDGILSVFDGGDLLIRDKFSFDMPSLSHDDWEVLKQNFFKNAESFAQKVEVMTDEQLNADFVKADYGTYYRNIDAMIEHAYYHLGQVSLIKKMIEQSN